MRRSRASTLADIVPAAAAVRKRRLADYTHVVDSPAMGSENDNSFATLANWFYSQGRPLPHTVLKTIDLAGIGFPLRPAHKR